MKNSRKTGDGRAALQEEFKEARVWLDGLDKINNVRAHRVGGYRQSWQASTFQRRSSTFPAAAIRRGSPFPWLISDCGLSLHPPCK